MAVSLIPQELVDLIVDNLHDDLTSLKSCALSARAFVASSRIHIFNRVEIKPPLDRSSTSQNPCQRFCALLASSPDIAPLVIDLSVVIVGAETSFEYVPSLEDNSDGGNGGRAVTWLMDDAALALVLPALCNLKRISVVENGPMSWSRDGEFGLNWSKLQPPLRAAFTNVFSSPRLESIHIRGIVVESPYHLLSLFSEATALKDLSLSRIYSAQGPFPDLPSWPDSQLWRPQLRFLLLDDITSPLMSRYLLSPQIALAHIRSLTLCCASNRGRDNIIRAAHDVEHLRLHVLYSSELTDPVRAALSANLRSIHLFASDMFRLMEDLFRSCPHDARIESVIFEGPGLDRALSRLSSFTNTTVESTLVHLRCFRMLEIRTYLLGFPFPVWAARVRAALPSLEARGMLRLTDVPVNRLEPRYGWE
ncbi:hypothetical protein C8R46DRAFT_1346439 [Mycena filopes]|nr:hypothetical protein C8R46DRAFT_1346439 [Mycena filopes]